MSGEDKISLMGPINFPNPGRLNPQKLGKPSEEDSIFPSNKFPKEKINPDNDGLFPGGIDPEFLKPKDEDNDGLFPGGIDPEFLKPKDGDKDKPSLPDLLPPSQELGPKDGDDTETPDFKNPSNLPEDFLDKLKDLLKQQNQNTTGSGEWDPNTNTWKTDVPDIT